MFRLVCLLGGALLTGLALLASSLTFALGQGPTTTPAVQAATTPNVVHVLGFENIKRNAKGKLTVRADAIQFDAAAARAEVRIASILDVFTGQDSKRLVGGTLGTVTMIAAPYETGRIISLFREKTDLLTLEYQDSSGGLHGAIFTLPKGQAAAIKKQLVAQGARASVPVEQAIESQGSKEGKKP